MPGPWVVDAACVGMDNDIFFPSERARLNPLAFTVCESCRIRRDCYEFAIRSRQPYGIWGGRLFKQRLTKTDSQERALRIST